MNLKNWEDILNENLFDKLTKDESKKDLVHDFDKIRVDFEDSVTNFKFDVIAQLNLQLKTISAAMTLNNSETSLRKNMKTSKTNLKSFEKLIFKEFIKLENIIVKYEKLLKKT